MVAKPKDNLIDKDYLFYMLNYINLTSVITGMAQPQITRKDLSPLKTTIPTIQEQTAIANILIKADREISTLEKQREIVKAQKKYLLNNLITGQIRLPEFVKKAETI